MNSRGFIPIIWIIAIVASLLIVTSVMESRDPAHKETDSMNR